MQCVILAGGLGTRMKSLSGDLPKALLPIAGHPFLKYQLDWFCKNGGSQVILCIGHKGQRIRDYAKDGSAWGLRIGYTEEKDQLLGTGGALRLAYDSHQLNDSFFVLYGDSYLSISLKEVWNAFERLPEPALMTVLHNKDQWDRSNACFDGEKVTQYDKSLGTGKPKSMDYIDYGLTVFRKTTIEKEIPSGQKMDMADVLHRLSVKQELAGFEVRERFYEVGSEQGLADFTRYIQNQKG